MVRRSRTPQGVRGLKHSAPLVQPHEKQSHSARSAWIETPMDYAARLERHSRTPQGVRGLKRYKV